MDTSEPLALLLIEDSPADSRLLQEHLRDAIQSGDVTLQVVRRLADAAQALREMSYSCVLLDLGLPDSRGIEAVTVLRAVERGLTMIVLTGSDCDETARQAMQLGVEDYIVKARHDSGLLLRRIRFAVHNRRRQQALDAEPETVFARGSRDAITGLANRCLFADRAELAIAQAERGGIGVALLSIGFNALPGPDEETQRAATERAQRLIGDALQKTLRRSDSVACTAWGEFGVVLMPTGTRFDATQIVQRLFVHLQELELAPLSPQPHIGMAIYPEDGRTWEVLFEQAGQAMFWARRNDVGVCISEREQTPDPLPDLLP